MNRDIVQMVCTRTGVATVIAVAGSVVFLKPMMASASGAQAELEQRQEYIQHGEALMGGRSGGVESARVSTGVARDSFLAGLVPDAHLQDQQVIQRVASDHELTITRVEPTRESGSSMQMGEESEGAELTEKEFRVECRGRYRDLVSFIHRVQHADQMMAVQSFRLLPSGPQEVRATITITMMQLGAVPDSLLSAVRSTEPAAADPGFSQRDSMNGGER